MEALFLLPTTKPTWQQNNNTPLTVTATLLFVDKDKHTHTHTRVTVCLVHNKQYTPREGRQIFITMKFQADLQSSAELEAADCPARV